MTAHTHQTAPTQFLEANGIEVVDLNDPTCIKMMQDFIAANPALWNEDIGEE